MKILFVCSKNSGRVVPFIAEQAESIRRLGHDVKFFAIEGKGILGYLKNWLPYRTKLRTFQPDVVHAHYGLSCLFANLQRKVPVVSTYHGSDINDPKVFRFSKIAIGMSARNVFVSEKTLASATLASTTLSNRDKTLLSEQDSAPLSEQTSPPAPLLEERGEREGRWKNVLIPCGVDTGLFVPMDQQEARRKMGLEPERKYVLFSGAFDNRVKNPELAKEAVALLPEVELLELKGYSREEVVWLMNAVDVVLMTSHTEGSPQFIKEAMACNCPVVSVEVGDVPEVIAGVEGCFIADRNPGAIAAQLQKVFEKSARTAGRKVIGERALDLMQVAKRLERVYGDV